MAINDEAARHFARAMVKAGREPSFIFEVMAAYYGEIGQAVALEVLEEHGRNTGEAKGVVSP
jgi:hypothetical protein